MRANNQLPNIESTETTHEIIFVQDQNNIDPSTPVRQTTIQPLNEIHLQQLLFAQRSRSLPNVSRTSPQRDRVAQLLAAETLTAERIALITENRAIVNELLANGMRRNELLSYDINALRNIINETRRVADAAQFDTFISLGGR